MQTKSDRIYYLIWSAVLFIIEFLIAVFVPSPSWLRDYGGDMLIIPLIYCLVRIFIKILPRLMPFLMCCVGFVFEIAQYFHICDLLGFEKGSVMRIIIGTSFSWMDILCYILGMLMIYTGIFIRKRIQYETA
ncbi:MAG: DUF2809 domain-containing protein [Oscillospiraceae bacterium]|nr:DUF2809 domain-containing protein [Oscillospiraceae bacterium]